MDEAKVCKCCEARVPEDCLDQEAEAECRPVLGPGEAQRLVAGAGGEEVRSREIPDLACSGEMTSSLVTGVRAVNNKIKLQCNNI